MISGEVRWPLAPQVEIFWHHQPTRLKLADTPFQAMHMLFTWLSFTQMLCLCLKGFFGLSLWRDFDGSTINNFTKLKQCLSISHVYSFSIRAHRVTVHLFPRTDLPSLILNITHLNESEYAHILEWQQDFSTVILVGSLGVPSGFNAL